MSAFYNPTDVKSIAEKGIVLDTNLLTSLSSDENYFQEFLTIFKDNYFYIDPIIKIEFLRDSSGDILQKKMLILQYDKFFPVIDHQQIYAKVLKEVTNISKIYAMYGNPRIPLGDLLIASRLACLGENVCFATLDKGDFSAMLFDRVAIVSIERKVKSKDGKPSREIVDHIAILKFNKNKYLTCCSKLQ